MTDKKNSKNIDSKNIDISIKELKHQKYHPLHGSSLVLEFKGKDVNSSIINTIRRACMDEIPIFAFPSEFIKIESNTTIFNNDYMRLRLSQLPILHCECELDYLDKEYINYKDNNYVKHPKDKNIEIYINAQNDTNDNINITTNDIKYLVDGEQQNVYSTEYPILLIQLRPKEVFKAHMKSILSNGLQSKIFSSSNTFYEYDDNNDNNIKLTVESTGQITECKILEKAIKYILKKLEDFEDKIKSLNNSNDTTLIFEFNNEDHTMGQVLNNAFQEHPKIIFSGLSKPRPLERLIKIKISSIDNTPSKYMLESIDYLKNVYHHILKKLYTH